MLDVWTKLFINTNSRQLNITKDEQSREIIINLDETKTILSSQIKQGNDYDNPHENDINKRNILAIFTKL